MRKSVQLGADARRTCPCFGVLCFLCAFIASLFGATSASADTPLPVLKVAPVAAPSTVLGMMNPYLIAAAAKKPKVLGFTFSQDLRDLVKRVETLAVHGVELNQRKLERSEKLNLRVQSRLGGGVLQLCYRR
ncbi:MAG: hypothetical protein ACN4G0_01970 [Polyangiales bacterium]